MDPNHQNRMELFSQIRQAIINNNFKQKTFPQPSTMTDEENPMILKILQKCEDLEEDVMTLKEECAEMKKSICLLIIKQRS